MKNILKHLLLVGLCLLSMMCRATPADFSMEVKNTNLPDAIRLMAKFLDMNVMISPLVQGSATIVLNHAYPQQAFDLLLASHGLAAWQFGNVWFIAPREELIKRQQEELKWRTLQTEALPLLTRIWQIKYAKASDIAKVLQEGQVASGARGQIRVDARTNILYVQDTAPHVASVNNLVKLLDVPVKQIMIAARLVSIDSDFEQELGVHFGVKSGDEGRGAKNILAEAGRYSVAVATLADGSLLDVKLAALENAGHAELISSPSLFTGSQQPASIEAGEEVPYQEVSESGGTGVAFKKAVLGLKVTPQALPGNNVLLALQINQDRPSSRMVLGVPTISTRQITTNIVVKSGRTIVLGGIYETQQEKAELGLPFISHLPFIGVWFKQRNTRENKRELLIFVTPTIMTPTT